MRRLVFGAVMASLLAATSCGGGGSGGAGGTAPSGPSGSPAPAPATFVVVGDYASDAGPAAAWWGYKATRLELLDESGASVSSVALPEGSVPLGVAGRRIFVASNGRLLRYSVPGWHVEDTGVARAAHPAAFAANPDGTRWVWAESDSYNGNYVTSRLVLVSPGLPDRVIATQTAQLLTLRPYVWVETGLLVAQQPHGVGGYILFPERPSVFEVLDPDTGATTPFCGGQSFAGVSATGTVGCFALLGDDPWEGPQALRLFDSSGALLASVDLPVAEFRVTGFATTDPGSGVMLVAGAEGVGVYSGSAGERYHTLRVDAAGGSAPFGPQDVTPVSGFSPWLPDGSVLAERRAGTAGGPALMLLRADGTVKATLPASVTPLGIVSW